MAVVLLESGSRTLLESGSALLLEASAVVVETSFLNASIDGADTRLAIRSFSLAELATTSRVSVFTSSLVSVDQTTTAAVRE